MTPAPAFEPRSAHFEARVRASFAPQGITDGVEKPCATMTETMLVVSHHDEKPD